MSRIAVVSYMSLNGMATSNTAKVVTDWYPYHDSLDQVYIDAYLAADAILFGRKSFEALRGYWPTDASKDEPPEMRAVNTMDKIVFSRSMTDPAWQPTRIERELTRERLEALKAEYPRGLLGIGSGSVVTQIAAMDLLDELTLIVAPSVVGNGEPYFSGGPDLMKFRLLDARPYGNGNVVLRYGK